jgi:trehalose 6-phosphate phosphatase
MSELERRLERIAGENVLLVASDYDGTLAPIVADPAAAWPLPEAVTALVRLAALPRTHVAVVSGRAREDLRARLGLPEAVHLVGSHGSEFGPEVAGMPAGIPPAARALRDRLRSELEALSARAPGTRVEPKPGSVAFHWREAEPAVAARARRAVEAGPATWAGVHVKHGKKVLELGVVAASKGEALAALLRHTAASAVCFVGDDVTDEDAFAILGEGDLGVKVGRGASRARFRVASPAAAARLLARLAALRAARLGDAAPAPGLGYT